MFFARLRGRAVLKVKGRDCRKFLQGLLTADVEALPAFGALLTPRGRWLHSLILLQGREKDEILLECQASRLHDLAERLKRYVLRSAVAIRPSPTAVWGLWDGSPRGGSPRGGLPPGAIADPRGIPGFARAYGRRPKGEEKSIADYESRSMALGLALDEPELSVGESIILENGFDEQNGLNWQKGCYLGQEVMAHIKNHSRIKRSLLVGQFTEGKPDRAVEVGGKRVGEVRRVLGGTALLLVEVGAMPALLRGEGRSASAPLCCRRPVWSA